MASLLTFVFFAFSYLLSLARSADECQPHQWKRDVGDIMCRYHASSGDDVNYYTCMDLATTYDISIDKFFELNPSVNANCDNIQASTQYCVKGCKCLPTYLPTDVPGPCRETPSFPVLARLLPPYLHDIAWHRYPAPRVHGWILRSSPQRRKLRRHCGAMLQRVDVDMREHAVSPPPHSPLLSLPPIHSTSQHKLS